MVTNQTTNEQIHLAFLGNSGPIPTSDFKNVAWSLGKPAESVTQKLVENLDDDNPLARAVRDGRNTVNIFTCDSLDPDHIKRDKLGRALEFTHKYALVFVVWDPNQPIEVELASLTTPISP